MSIGMVQHDRTRFCGPSPNGLRLNSLGYWMMVLRPRVSEFSQCWIENTPKATRGPSEGAFNKSGSIRLYHDYIARFLKPAILLKTLVSRFRKHWSVPQTYIHTKKHLQTVAQVATAFVLPPAPTEDMTPTSRTQLNNCDSCSKPCSNVASWDHRHLVTRADTTTVRQGTAQRKLFRCSTHPPAWTLWHLASNGFKQFQTYFWIHIEKL